MQQIIIVTRDAPFRDALRRACSGQGCRVETAETVEIASEIASRRKVCVMIADASIQDEGDGVGLARAIHGQNPASKCFLIVGEESPSVLGAAENEPWLRLVVKPIRMLQFAADVVDAVLESKSRG